jgi:hypothetical protein
MVKKQTTRAAAAKKRKPDQNGISLRLWAINRISSSFAMTALHELPIAGVLQRIKAPAAIWQAFVVPDGMDAGNDPEWLLQEYSIKQCFDGVVPDLESRSRCSRRLSGQFYTPEDLALSVCRLINVAEFSSILDPACGDGSFLMAAASLLAQTEASAGNRKDFLARLNGFDIDTAALFVCLIRLITTFPGCGWPELQQRDFLLQPPVCKYQLIMGNPPYRVNLETETKKSLMQQYATAEGEKDLYTFFFEGAIRALTLNGSLVLLTSHTFLVNHQCRKIRDLLFMKNRVTHLLMLPERFFARAPGVLPVVSCILRQAPQPGYRLKICSDYAAGCWKAVYDVEASCFADGSGLRRAIVPPSLGEVFSALEVECCKLGEVCRVGVGIQESHKRDDRVSRFVSDAAESDRHRPVLKGRELSPFRISWAGKYIDYGPHLAFAGNEKTFLADKVLYQNIRNERLRQRLVAAFDQRGFFPKNSLSYIVPASGYSGHFICAILNSILVNAWFSGRFHSFHITVTQVRQIPLPSANDVLKAEVEKLACDLATESDRAVAEVLLQALNQKVCECYLGPGDHSALLRECDNLLDHAVCL